jgi:hypothetical protein
MFPQKFISRCRDNHWPHHSLEFSAADFIMWGCLKDRVYETSPANIPDLKQCIQECIEAITNVLLPT